MKLFRFSQFPPGGYPYEQVFKGIIYKFPDEGLDIDQQTSRILKFRKANGLPRATFNETLEDLNVFTCARLGNDPNWCGDGSRAAKSNVQQVRRGGCAGCGARLR